MLTRMAICTPRQRIYWKILMDWPSNVARSPHAWTPSDESLSRLQVNSTRGIVPNIPWWPHRLLSWDCSAQIYYFIVPYRNCCLGNKFQNAKKLPKALTCRNAWALVAITIGRRCVPKSIWFALKCSEMGSIALVDTLLNPTLSPVAIFACQMWRLHSNDEDLPRADTWKDF